MKKTFCDICGNAANDKVQSRLSLTLADSVLCDYKASIKGVFILSFENHSTGFGGPPDLCNNCYNTMITKYKNSMSEE